MRYIFLIIITIVTALCIHLYFHLGIDEEPVIHPIEKRSFTMLGKAHVGPYYKISKVIEQVENWAKQQQVFCNITYGLYLDDPSSTEEDRLRSEGGCLTNKETKDLNLPEQFRYHVLGEQEYLKLSFSGSPAISPFTVYPKAFEWIKNSIYQQSGPVIETYDVSNNKMNTYYYFPIKKVNY